MNGSNRRQRRRIDAIQNPVNALQKIAHAPCSLQFFHRLRPLVKFAQIGSGAETGFQLAVHDERMRFFLQSSERPRELLQFFERQRAQFVARIAVQRQFDDPAFDVPRQRLPFELRHTQCVPFRQPQR